MPARNLSQEAHLWYTITSPDYLSRANTFLHEAFALFQDRVLQHPFIADYAPVPQWGSVMEHLLSSFDNARAVLIHGEFGPMQSWASRVSDIPRGLRESNMEWLGQPDQDRIMLLVNEASRIGNHFLRGMAMSQAFSSPAYRDRSTAWRYEVPEDLGISGSEIARYYEDAVFPVRPHHIPEYTADISVTCKTGDVVPWTGVWVPATGIGTAALAFARQGVQVMQPAYEAASMDADGDIEEFALIECTWHAVRPTGRMIAHPNSTTATQEFDEGHRLSCEAGFTCVRSGYWFTPAKAGSRRYFKHGELMPEIGGDYGATIWQWDHNQDPPKL